MSGLYEYNRNLPLNSPYNQKMDQERVQKLAERTQKRIDTITAL